MTLERRDDVTVIDNPLAQEVLTTLRDRDTDSVTFRRELDRLGRICGQAIAPTHLDTQSVEIETPLGPANGHRLSDDIVIVGVLRAAVPMMEGLLDALPRARQGLVSASRDESAGMDTAGRFPIAIDYIKIPPLRDQDTVIVVDPMLATGSTMASVLAQVDADGTGAQCIALSAVSAPAGIERISEVQPSIDIITVSVDDHLTDDGFIVPGLGDAGDRAFGTTS